MFGLKNIKRNKMKWISVDDETIQPPFNKRLLIMDDFRYCNYFFGRLIRIEITAEGREMIWDIHHCPSKDDMRIKYWCEITNPEL